MLKIIIISSSWWGKSVCWKQQKLEEIQKLSPKEHHRANKVVRTYCAQIQSVLNPRENPEVQLLLPWSHLLRGDILGLGVKGWSLLTAKDGVLTNHLSVGAHRRWHPAGRSSDSSPVLYQLGGQQRLKPGLRMLWITGRCRCPAHLSYGVNHWSSARWSLVAHM